MTLAAGTRLGSYEVLSLLGAGGMGEVYRAKDAKLRREVAIKVLPESLSCDPDALARFEREAFAVAALSHPNILSIFDFGNENGTAYAVTELLEGETLRARLDGSSIAQKQALDYVQQIARGLSAAHGKGVVHRDLKPENVFVTKDGHVKILDFGLAKRIAQTTPEEETSTPTESSRTEPGTVMGTMGYMSPEQLMGLPVDHRTDIFSLGAVFYELLSGHGAFRRATVAETIAAILKDDPPELAQSGKAVSPAVEHVVRHCLEKDRENRFQTAKDISFALTEASSPTSAAIGRMRIPSFVGWARRNTWTLAATMVLALAGLGLFLSTRSKIGVSSGGVKRIAVLPFENVGAPEDDYFADGIADEVRAKLTSVPSLLVIARASSALYKKTTKTPKQIAQELDTTYLLTATVRWEKNGETSRVHVMPELIDVSGSRAPGSKWQQPFDAALTDIFQVQSDIASRVAEALGVALGEGQRKQLSEKPTKNLAAYDAYLKGEEASAALAHVDLPSLRKAGDFYSQAVALDPEFALAWARIGLVNAIRYGNGTPIPWLAESARDAAEKAVALAPEQAEGYRALGSYYSLVHNDFRRSLEEYMKGLRFSPRNTDLIRGIAGADQALGRWDEALEYSRQVVSLDPRRVANLRILGGALTRVRQWTEARRVFDRGLEIAPDDLDLIERKTETFLGEGNLAGARAFLREAQGRVAPTELVAYMASFQDLGWALDDEQTALLRRLTPSAFDDDESVWAICQAQACAFAGDAACTLQYAERARKATDVHLQAAPDDTNLLATHAIALAYVGRKEEAIREAEQVCAVWPPTRDAVQGAYLRHQLARVYIITGEQEKALDVIESLLTIPYLLTPGWLRIDPNFQPLRASSRFRKIAGLK